MLAFALRADGWYLRSDIIWSKPNPMPESVTDRPTKAHEYVFLLTRQPRYWFDAEAVREPNSELTIEVHSRYRGSPDTRHAASDGRVDGQPAHRGSLRENGIASRNFSGRNIRSVWQIATQPYPEAHFATFPEELARRCILAGCPTRVCRVCGKPSVREVSHGLDLNRPQARRAQEIADANGLTAEHIEALKACGISDTGKALVTTNGTGKNDLAVQALAEHARSVLKGYSREFLIRGSSHTTGWSDCECTVTDQLFRDSSRYEHETEDHVGDTGGCVGSGGTESVPELWQEGGTTDDLERVPGSSRSVVSMVQLGRHQGSGEAVRPVTRTQRDSDPSYTYTGLTSSKWRPGLVLDPFIGSGTVAKVARDHGRHAIGIDLNESYLELAARRLQQLSLLSETDYAPPAKQPALVDVEPVELERPTLTGGAYSPPGQSPHSNARRKP